MDLNIKANIKLELNKYRRVKFMNVRDFLKVSRKYKECPKCNSSWKEDKLQVSLEDDIIAISCKCGFIKKVDKNNKEVK